MSSLILRNIPPELHSRLKRQAELHHRSMTREAVAILEKELGVSSPIVLPDPIPAHPALTVREIERAIREGRE
jgi:plasmid stability protein